MSEEKCKFYKKQFLSNYCELFKQPCYGKHCNFIKEFTRLNELEQDLQACKEENEKLKERNEHLEKVHEVDTHFCTAFINLKEGLSKILHHYYFTRGKYNLESMCLIPAIQTLVGRLRGKVDKQEKEIELLTQQNKQMREFINNIKNLCNEDWEDMTVDKFQNQLLQTLKGVE